MKSHKIWILFFVCNVLQASSPEKVKSVVGLAEELVNHLDHVRHVVRARNRIKFLQKTESIDDATYADYEDVANVQNIKLVTLLQEYTTIAEQVDDYVQSGSTDITIPKTPDARQRKFDDTIFDLLENVEKQNAR